MTKANFPQPELLAFTVRGDIVETLHEGWICVLNHNKKVVYHKGRIEDKVFLRSSLKPIQAIPVADDDNKFEITSKELAVISGSHSGSKKHTELLKKFLKKNAIQLSGLKCGTHLPLDEIERNNLIRKKILPSPLHNNCSGKHLGMLYVCKKKGWDPKTYLNRTHPLQKEILNIIKKLSETKNISTATDGCGVPTFALPITNIAKMFSNFTQSKNKNYHRIINAMINNPYFVGGKNQIDSEIMKASKKRLIAKVGAEGIITVAYKGNSAVVKISDGSQKIRSFVILKLLKKLNWLKENEIKNSILENILKGEIKNHAGNTVGKIKVLL
ncbi:MAG: asparaginase [Candidatus Melainabacteria bacterium]|nr:asparaginase [Candidatus Melainabacteria bacterium]